MAFGKTECTCISFGPTRNVKESRDLYIKYKSHAIKSQAQVKYLDIDIDHLSIIKKVNFRLVYIQKMPCHWATIRFIQELLFIVIFLLFSLLLVFQRIQNSEKIF